jgi:2-C-methyl-D-erythritol 2,4-cyclodiphosphate synthase
LENTRTRQTTWPQLRIGIGHDTHRLESGGPLRLGGVTIDFDRHLVGHSDADGLLHAVTDALLGATALGDIGDHFPDTDPANRDRDSAEMLSLVLQKIVDLGWSVVNVDCIVFAERPRLSGYKVAIRTRLAEILGLSPDQVGLKAKTGEGVGQVGHQESIEAQAVVLLASR